MEGTSSISNFLKKHFVCSISRTIATPHNLKLVSTKDHPPQSIYGFNDNIGINAAKNTLSGHCTIKSLYTSAKKTNWMIGMIARCHDQGFILKPSVCVGVKFIYEIPRDWLVLLVHKHIIWAYAFLRVKIFFYGNTKNK